MKNHEHHHWFYSTKLGAKIQAKQILRIAAEINASSLSRIISHSIIPYTLETVRELEMQGFNVEVLDSSRIVI